MALGGEKELKVYIPHKPDLRWATPWQDNEGQLGLPETAQTPGLHAVNSGFGSNLDQFSLFL